MSDQSSTIKKEIICDSPFENSDLTNAIKIIHSRDSSDNTEKPKDRRQTSVTKNISFATPGSSMDSMIFEKENEQPNNSARTGNLGHCKNDTVICYSTDESQRYQLEKVLKACISQMDTSQIESSFLYKADKSQVGFENQPKNEIKVSIDAENMLRSLQESIKKQDEQNKKIASLQKKNRSLNQALIKSKNSLSQHLSNCKCDCLASQLKEASKIIDQLEASLKTSDSKRQTLSRKLEEQVLENDEKSKKMRDKHCGSPKGFNRLSHPNSGEENMHFELFQDMSNIITKVLEEFQYPELLAGLTLKDDRQLKKICSKLQKYQQLSACSFGFINGLAKILSLKVTCEKYIQMSSTHDHNIIESQKRYSVGKTMNSSSKDKLLSRQEDDKRKPSSRTNSKKKQSNYLNYKKQVITSRNFGPCSSNSVNSYFYSNRSGNEPSNIEDNDSYPAVDTIKNDFNISKPSLRKNVYESLPK